MYLSIDRDFKPLERTKSSKPGYVSEKAEALLSGTIDQLDLDGRTAYINDYKSGWSTTSVTDKEPPFYAALVFAHFPHVDRVEFSWEFVRVHIGKATTYTRADLEWIHSLILGEHARREEIEKRYRAGGALTLDPFAGLCTFCAIRCPLRAAVEAGAVEIPPVQTEADARAVAALHYAAGELLAKTRKALLPWAGEHGPMALGGGFVVQIETKTRRSLPLKGVLDVLGFNSADLGPVSPRYSVPMDKLTVGGLCGYEKARMRAGMKEELTAIGNVSPETKLTVRRSQIVSIAPVPPEEDTDEDWGFH